MKKILASVFVCAVCLIAVAGTRTERVHAQPPAAPQSPNYLLTAWRIAGTNPTEHMWLIEDNDGRVYSGPGELFKTLASPDLRAWISHLPAGSCVTYNYIGANTPAKRQDQHDQGQVFPEDPDSGMADFGQFCRNHKVAFVTSEAQGF